MNSETFPDNAWEEFLQWLRSTKSAGHPDSVMDAYQTHVRGCGTPVMESERRLAAIVDKMREETEGWRWLFNRVYAGAEFRAMLPNEFLLRATQHLKPGRALDVCAGEGRNAAYLAARGWQVTAFDVSERGLAEARGKVAGGNARFIQSAEQVFAYGYQRWDLIVISYAPVRVTQPAFMEKIRSALRPAGSVVIEGFALDPSVGSTRFGALEIHSGELLEALGGFRVEAYETVMGVPDWGNSASRIVRLFARTRESIAKNGSKYG